MQTQERRPLAESYPGLDVRKIVKLAKRGAIGVDWFNEGGLECFEARVHVRPEEIEVALGMCDGLWQEYSLLWRIITREGLPPRTVFECNRCSSHVEILYHCRGEWACRKCHRLVYASQYLSNDDKALVAHSALSREIAQGRAPYERLQAWNAKLARQAELKALIDSTLPAPAHRGVSRRRLTAVYSHCANLAS